ncbi:ParB-like nuclease domain protein [Microbacterium phage Rasputia]|nr:ParB-like nuclease domain protein [Microbacterium phage Rasputia]
MSDIQVNTSYKVVPIEALIPYENNPRRIPQDAIDAVALSIQTYGWQQPIVVDKDNVIVVGHTRRLAAQQLGIAEVPVLVSTLPEEKLKEYRLVDNRTGEMSGWDHNALVMELREFESSLLEAYFPDIDLEASMITSATGPSDAELKWAQEKTETVKGAAESSLHTTGVTCPSCAGHFTVRTRSLPGMDNKTVEEIAGGEA